MAYGGETRSSYGLFSKRPCRENKVKTQRPSRMVAALVLAGFSCLTVTPILAAERLTVRLGPVERSASVSDLEQFVKTGKLSRELEVFGPFLTQGVRQALDSRLELDSKIAEGIVEDLLSSPQGQRLLAALLLVFPEQTAEEIKMALQLAFAKANGLSLLGILKAFPGENVTVDLTATLAVASRINTSYWETQIARSIIKRELTVDGAAFKPTNLDPTALGPFSVQEETLNFSDQQRQRSLAADIYWGNNSGSRSDREAVRDNPLVVMSHGFGSDRTSLSYLARHLASHGITVVALEHPGSNKQWLDNLPFTINPSELLPPGEFADRPQDVSFVLDELAKLNRQGDNPSLPSFNTEKVVAIGHSFGGYTALALAGARPNLEELKQFCQRSLPVGRAPADWLQCAAVGDNTSRLPEMRDRRIIGIVALNPTAGKIFGNKGLQSTAVPTLFFSTTEDAWAPAVSHQLQPFLGIPEPKYLVTAFSGSHFSFTAPDSPNPFQNKSTEELEPPAAQTEPLRQLVGGIAIAFIKQQTPQAKTYAPFLTPAYAEYRSTAEIPLRLNTEIPSRLARWLEAREETIGQR
ncbi:MAG TPA: alpha/beta hydrolase [Oscillatoriaceae cyanobacterium M33_DOE_052]|nr:alpha/beta hydrolase [Oscillatoriaceae cyanobacterium M33_DOE_052]